MAWKFLITHLPRGLRARRFSEPTLRPSGASSHWKNTVFRHVLAFSCIYIFFFLILFLLFFFFLIFLFSKFFSSTLLSSNFSLLSASSLLCFSFIHIIENFISKFPLIIFYRNIFFLNQYKKFLFFSINLGRIFLFSEIFFFSYLYSRTRIYKIYRRKFRSQISDNINR
jgi:hypothetical protein